MDDDRERENSGRLEENNGSTAWRRLLSSVVFVSLSTGFASLGRGVDLWDSYCPRFLKWRRTSDKELEDTDKKILNGIPCIKEKKFVAVGEDKLWSVSCNPDKTKTPIIMVHGMGGGVGLWAMNLDALSEKRPVYAFDLLGFGRSSRPSFQGDNKDTEDMFVNSIENYRKAMGLEKFILLGHSLGGYLSAAYTLRYPQHVEHLILADPWGMAKKPPQGTSQLSFPIRTIVNVIGAFNPLSIVRGSGPLGPWLVQKYRPRLAQTFGGKLGDDGLLHDYIYHCNAQKPSGEIGFKNLSWNVGWAKEPMIQRLKDIDSNVPITFVYGAQSWVDRTTGWKFKNSHNGYVDVQILRGAGHHVYADRYDLFNTLINAIADSVDQNELPSLDRKLVRRIHAAPSSRNLDELTPKDPDFERPLAHADENPVESDFGAEQGQSASESQRVGSQL